MCIDKADFPQLFQEKLWPWGPTRAVFELGVNPPDDLISNVNLVPYIRDEWVIVKHEDGWCIVGGTLEPSETYLEAIHRELREEAGGRLKLRAAGALSFAC